MTIQRIEYGSLADSELINSNFSELETEISGVGSSISTLQSNISSVNSTLNSNINTLSGRVDALDSAISDASTGLTAIATKLDNLYNLPDMTALIDWDTMAFKANVADVRNINNTTTGIKAYGGDYGLLRSGDIYLKEDFTNYKKIMVVWTDDGCNYYNATILETWFLDYLLSQSKGRTSLINQQFNGNYYWAVWGYDYSYVYSNVTYQTTKQYFSVNGQQNCGMIEIFGLGASSAESEEE